MWQGTITLPGTLLDEPLFITSGVAVFLVNTAQETLSVIRDGDFGENCDEPDDL
jgi:hypothetical protein